MAKYRIRRRINKKLTDEERERHRKIREQVEAEKPRLNAIGLKYKREYEARREYIRQAIASLKSTREAQGLSLSDVEDRTGIDKGNLSRLENGPRPNPTVETLVRYAEALGKQVVISLEDAR